MPSAAKGAVLIMSEKKTSGIKNFFEEFKAFAMRGNVLDMAVGVVVGVAHEEKGRKNKRRRGYVCIH